MRTWKEAELLSMNPQYILVAFCYTPFYTVHMYNFDMHHETIAPAEVSHLWKGHIWWVERVPSGGKTPSDLARASYCRHFKVSNIDDR